uniref:Betacarotene 15,15'monooxygenase 1 [Salmo salar] n=1 Tax=Lepeophtheirus salmonis TaxID=72036 RepID=A0A0K2TQG9_LEPSM
MTFQANRYNSPSSSFSEIRGRSTGQNLPGWLQEFMILNSPSSHGYHNQWSQERSFMNSFRIHDGGNYVTFTKRYPSDSHGFGPSMSSNENRSYGDSCQPSSSRQYELRRDDGYNHSILRPFGKPFTLDDCNCYHFRNMNDPYYEKSLGFGDKIDMSRFINIHSGYPLRDHNGETYNLGASFMSGNKYYFMKHQGNTLSQDVSIIASIPCRFPNHIGYFHTYGMTDNYLIFCEQPWAFDVNKMRNSSSQDTYYRDCLDVMAGEKNHFYIVDKRTGRRLDITYATDKPYYFFNFINCYEYSNHIIIDIMSYDGSNVFESLRMNKFKSRFGCCGGSSDTQILRFSLPIQGHQGGIEMDCMQSHETAVYRNGSTMTICPQYPIRGRGFEYPIINPRFNFRKYKFTYFVDRMSTGSESSYGNSITKINIDSGDTISWKTGNDHCYPHEIVFIPNPNGMSEDDGVLFSCVSNPKDQRGSYLVFINPRNMEEMSRVYFDEPIPFGTHSSYTQHYKSQ